MYDFPYYFICPFITSLAPSSLPCTNLHRPIAVLWVQVPLGQTPSVCTFCLEVREGMSWRIQAQKILSTVWYCPHKYDALNAHCFSNGDPQTECFNLWFEVLCELCKSSKFSENHAKICFSYGIVNKKSQNKLRSGKVSIVGLNTSG